VSFHGTDQSYRLFQSRDFNRPTTAPPRLFDPAKSVKTPGFLVGRESAFRGFLASLTALCTRSKLPASKNLRNLYRDASLTGFRPPGIGIANSFLLHCALILGMIFVPMAFPARAPALSSAFLPPEVIFYQVPEHRTPSHLPRIAPRGPGGRPGSGILPKLSPEPGKTISNGDLTVISKPMHPDNTHQTIIQPASPPDLRIPNDLKLPNLSLGSLAAPKKPTFDLSIKKPTQENAKLSAEMATPLAETNVDYSLTTNLRPTNSQPKLPIPTGAIPRPVRRDAGVDGASGSEVPDVGVAGDGRAILAIGIDPSGPNSGVALPPGNRWGDFSIAPGAGNSGSPGGRSGGVPGGGGSGGDGRAGDQSVGLGPGREGGGGGKDGPPSSISVKGTGNSMGGIAMLDPHLEAKMIYPVGLNGPKLRKNQMIVSAGPIGGGGLGVYGALPCSKIYTIFLPMNDANWTMQYCQKSGSSPEGPEADPRSTVIRLEAGLVPPDPDLESRFDFKRVSVPPGKGRQMIVLKGTLREDGTVDALEVYQGIVPQMDEAARLAFSRWKFKPAMRAGKPVALELLVGIPPEIIPTGDSR
jgi:Gram-negative bacterial TonB protein C-terminal